MKSGPENKVKKAVKDLLDEYKIFHWPAAASPYGVAGVPDRIAIVKGQCWGIEVKAPGKHATALQLAFGERMQRSGGRWFLVDSDEALAGLRRELEEVL